MLFRSRLIERFMSHRLSAGYLAQFFFCRAVSTSHACIYYSLWLKQWAQFNLRHKDAQEHFSAAYFQKKKSLSMVWIFCCTIKKRLHWLLSINGSLTNLFISLWFTAISWSFTVIHEGAPSNPFWAKHHMPMSADIRGALRPESLPATKLNGFVLIFFFFFLTPCSRLKVTALGDSARPFAIPAARCAPTEGRAASAFCPTICKCCPCPPDPPELNLSAPEQPQKTLPHGRREEGGGRGRRGNVARTWKMEGRGERKIKGKMRAAGTGCGAKRQRTI